MMEGLPERSVSREKEPRKPKISSVSPALRDAIVHDVQLSWVFRSDGTFGAIFSFSMVNLHTLFEQLRNRPLREKSLHET
jgi:hypothetical protein